MNKNTNKAFTLVELIVVITILAILGTIAFLSLQGYSQNARDGVRISDIKNIEKGLGVMLVKSGIVPTPDDTKINITASGTLIGIQGYAGKLVQAQIGMSKDSGKDPLDGTFYTYSTNPYKNQYQILGFMEGSVSNNLFGNSYAVDYSQRNIVTRGQELGILLGASGSTLNQPAQEFNVGNFETQTGTTVYKAIFSSSNAITASGGTLLSIAFLNKGEKECRDGLTELKLSNGQIWSCLNLGAIKVWDGITQPTNCGGTSTINCNAGNTWIGDYYQWGRNEPVNTTITGSTYSGIFTGLLGHNNFILGEATYGDWWQNDAGSGANTTLWTGVNPQGPCPSGRHVPSQNDWQLACNNLLSTSCTNSMSYNSLIATILRLPFSGYRRGDNGYHYSQSNNANYWSSTPNSNYPYYFNFGNTYINPVNANSKGYGFSIRCLKN